MFKDKGIIFGVLATIIIIVGGILLMSRGGSSPSATSGSTVSSEILIPKGDYETSGIVNGNYLPASSSAKVTIVEFGDYECPACGSYHPFVKQALTEFAGKINFVFRNFPLSQHPNAPISADAAEAAGLQGKFWQMHDKLYESQNDWSSSPDPTSIFVGYAQALGLNTSKFTSDLSASNVKNKIQSDTNDGNLANINATPTFFINGVAIVNLPGTYNDFKQLIVDTLNTK